MIVTHILLKFGTSKLIDQKISLFEPLRTSFFKVKFSAILTLARIVGEKCRGLLQFSIETTIYSKIMQSMKNAAK